MVFAEGPETQVDFEEFRATLEREGFETTMVKVDGGTIVPPISSPGSDFERRVESLPVMALADGAEASPELEIQRTLGEGGMGVVRLANQVPLGREVAVKSVRSNMSVPEATLQILREAWITGSLEHPNVVPIYALGKSEDNQPLIVMKRIAGTPWKDILHDPAQGKTEDALERNLQILIQVTNAIEFAHSRRIVHRDLKPENVMIGDFGEVYVLDWGIAVSLEDDGSGRFPLATSIKGVAGTPAYLAPEMLDHSGARISERTDVYLLGAILHEIVTKEVRHRGDSLLTMLHSAHVSEPFPYGPSVPSELVNICHKAMHVNPAERFADVADLRNSIAEFLRHRDSIRLGDEAMTRLSQLEEAAGAQKKQSDGHQAQLLFGECSFGFQQALRVWPDNLVANKGLRSAKEIMAELAVSREDLHTASRLLQEIQHPSPELVNKVEALRARHEKKEENLKKLEQLEHDLDLDVARGPRAWIALGLGVTWIFAPISSVGMEKLFGMELSTEYLLYDALLLWIILLFVAYVFRKPIQGSLMNRRLSAAVALTAFAMTLSRLTALCIGVSFADALLLDFVSFFLGTAMMSLTIDSRLKWAALIYLVFFGLSAIGPPAAVVWLVGFGSLFAFGSVWYVWTICDQSGREPIC